jgi:hypothetical protein
MLVAVICYSYELEDLLFLVLIPLPLSDDEWGDKYCFYFLLFPLGFFV